MATMLDLAKFTFSAEQIRDINELVFEELLQAPDINLIHTVYPGIVYDKEVGFITGGGLVGKAGQGCDPTPQDWNIGTRKVLWQPKSWEIFLDECAKDLENTAVVYAMNKHTRVDDLTDTDYMAIVVEVLTDAVKKFIYRLVWLNDTEAKAGTDGTYTAGLDIDYFNIIDGLFKQLEAATVGTSKRVAIAANSEANKANQLSKLTGDMAYSVLSQMYYNAPIEMRSSNKMRFLVTQSIADAYQQYLIGKGIESTYRNLTEGFSALQFLGVEVIALPIWDSMIRSYQDLGAKYYFPHRAVLIEKENTAIGTPSEQLYEEFDIWYDKTSRKNYILLKDKLDAKILNPDRLVYAI